MLVCVYVRQWGRAFALSHHVPTVCLLTLTEIHLLAAAHACASPSAKELFANAPASAVNNAAAAAATAAVWAPQLAELFHRPVAPSAPRVAFT